MTVPRRPAKLGPYEVVVKIAGGGMATIYLGRARGPGGQQRVAALKVIRHELGHHKSMKAMFHDEAKILARMSHPNIAAHWEHGFDEEEHFIAMELLVGRTLRDVWDACKERKVSLRLDHAAWIAARVADALHHAHSLKDEKGAPLNVVHRDVNPTNIFLTFEGEVKLFDFGLAKARGQSAQSSAGIVKGKLPYLSPEAIEQLPLDGRSDIYTLGTTLWELTTMRRLFKRDDDVETVMATRAGLVPDPRARLPEYPEALWKIIRRALARDREERYQTAGELAGALDAFVESQGQGDDMVSLTSAILDALFPGEREKRAMWLRHTSASRPQRTTLPPPVPVAGMTESMAPPAPAPAQKRPSSKHRIRKA
ncbi:MAG TPA: serine/threonine-protein kinase [Polyangiaceae bacterium]